MDGPAHRKRKSHLTIVRSDDRHEGYSRPRFRADCKSVPRPCPWVSCRYNLYLDVSTDTGALSITWKGKEPWEVPADSSCALDVAERGPMLLEEIGDVLNRTRERVRQNEKRALAKLREYGLFLDEDE